MGKGTVLLERQGGDRPGAARRLPGAGGGQRARGRAGSLKPVLLSPSAQPAAGPTGQLEQAADPGRKRTHRGDLPVVDLSQQG